MRDTHIYSDTVYIVAFVQEIGRAGRDGLSAQSQVLFNASDISTATGITKEMKEYCETTDCRRRFLANYFAYNFETLSPLHSCCDNCSRTYSCSSCSQPKSSISNADQSSHANVLVTTVFQLLSNLFNRVNSSVLCSFNLKPEILTGLNNSLAMDIAQHAHELRYEEALTRLHPQIDTVVAKQVTAIIERVMKGQ